MGVPVHMIVAVCSNNGIGYKGNLPWQLRKELQYFGRMTKEVQDPKKMNAVIMGRKTWESLPKSWQPLPGRVNFVLSTQTLDLKGAAIHCRNYNDVITKLNDPELVSKIETAWIIGGAKVYEDAVKLSICQRVYLTKIMKEFECDTFLNIDLSKGFKEISDQRVPKEVQEENEIQYTFHVYEKQQ